LELLWGLAAAREDPEPADHDGIGGEGAKAPAERGVELRIVNAALGHMSVNPCGRIERGRALLPLEEADALPSVPAERVT
jgi:hypothetical protein